MQELESKTQQAGEDLFARNIRMLRLELTAWIAQVEGQEQDAVLLMSLAVELEKSTPKHSVTPGPTIPAEELLGDLLMEQKKPLDAHAAYWRSLELYPKRLNSMRGAAALVLKNRKR